MGRIGQKILKMFNILFNYLKEKVNLCEGVLQLLPEIGLSKEDQEVVRQAIEAGTIKDKFPPYNEMMDELIRILRMKKVSFAELSKEDKFMDQADVRGKYIEVVLLPIAKGRKPSISSTIRLKDLTSEQHEILEQMIFEIITFSYVDQLKELEDDQDVLWTLEAAKLINNDYNAGNNDIRSALADFEEDQPGSAELFTGLSNYERKQLIHSVIQHNWNEMKDM